MKSLLIAFIISAFAVVSHAAPQMKWEEKTDKSIALLRDGRILWQLNFDAKEGKPYFHPLNTIGGQELTWHRPADHPWHLGLWFSWKYINGLNYWETDRKTGLCEGTNQITEIKIDKHEDFSATVLLKLAYHPPGKPAVMTETRIITVTPPQADGTYRINWHAIFTADDKPVILDRTPPMGQKKGVAWGGYAGLTYRSVSTMTQRTVLDSKGWSTSKKIMGSGKPANWIDLSGLLVDKKTTAGIAMFDHPDNFRHPTPWYVYMAGTFGAIKSAPIFHEPYTMKPGEKITLFYRALVHDGKADADKFNTEYDQFSKIKPPQ